MLLTDDHVSLDGLLSDLIAALDANDAERSLACLDLFWARLAVHIRAEHLQLFPAILNALSEKGGGEICIAPSSAEAEEVIEELRQDHDFFMRELARAVQLIRELSAKSEPELIARQLADVRAKIAALSERLAAHNRLEESRIYLWAGDLLSDCEQSALAERVQNELENLPPRFSDYR